MAQSGNLAETDVDAMIENMRRQRPVFTPVERAAHDSDRVVFDYQARIGGKPFEGSDLTDVRIVLGTRQAMPELEEGLKGVRFHGPGSRPTLNIDGSPTVLKTDLG